MGAFAKEGSDVRRWSKAGRECVLPPEYADEQNDTQSVVDAMLRAMNHLYQSFHRSGFCISP